MFFIWIFLEFLLFLRCCSLQHLQTCLTLATGCEDGDFVILTTTQRKADAASLKWFFDGVRANTGPGINNSFADQIKRGGVPSCYHPSYKSFHHSPSIRRRIREVGLSMVCSNWRQPVERTLCNRHVHISSKKKLFARGLMWHLKLSHTRSIRPDKFLSITSLVYISVKSSFIQLVPSYLIMSWPQNCLSSLIGRFLFSRINGLKFSTVCLGGEDDG